jgi:hypothetical protein
MKHRTKTEPASGTGAIGPGVMTPEQVRMQELTRIARERAKQSRRGGLWFIEQFLPDDLKAEWRALHAATAANFRTFSR